MTPNELIIRLRDPDCNCCPFYEECNNSADPNGEYCLLFIKAADCIETLLQKGNENK